MPTKPKTIAYHRTMASAFRAAFFTAQRLFYQQQGFPRHQATLKANQDCGEVAKAANDEYQANRIKAKTKED